MVCDFAETYHILNWRVLKPSLAAALAFGLPDNSRTKRKLSGSDIGLDTMLLAAIADRLTILAWQNTEDGHKGRNKPKSILDDLMHGGKRAKNSATTYASPDAFNEAWRKATEE